MILLQLVSLSILFWSTYVYGQLDGYFLPENVEPVRYTITVEVINFSNFRGTVSVEIKALEDTKNVTLHSNNLLIDQDSIEVIDSNGNSIERTYSTVDEEKNFYIINLEDVLLKNETYSVTISNFVGSLENEKTGFYRGHYICTSTAEKYFFVTYLEPTNARKVFPCFDEPRLKASYVINLIRPSDKVSASNMPLRETIDLGNNRYQDVYQESVPMSTYTVAFIICDYKYTQSNGIIRVFAPPEYIEHDAYDYSLRESGIILETIENYTDIKYALPKLDLVSLEDDQSQPVAMENYGLVTFSKSYISCTTMSSPQSLQMCVHCIAHELVHQWFGNLVTPRNWRYMWLNEGFATYLGYEISHKIEPEWRSKEGFVIRELYPSFNTLNKSVNYIFENKDFLQDIIISYSRAASIIRMTSYFLTKKVFKKALRLYLKKNQFKSTVPEDLYDAYEKALKGAPRESLLGNLSVYDILSTWNDIPNYPIVTVKRNYKTGSVTFTQENVDKNLDSVWYIPITYVFENSSSYDFNNAVANFWLTTKTATIYPNITDGWLLVNKMVAGYYRVNYDKTNWERIRDFFQSKDFKEIPFVNWVQILIDVCYFANRQDLKKEIFYNLIEQFSEGWDLLSQFSYNFNSCLGAVYQENNSILKEIPK